uniref:Uncharacterized protein n=1 Tax=Oryza barthii TaxID=65489 RepID=A0A0D3HPS7_9ORYZ
MKYYRHFLFMVISVSWRPYCISAHEFFHTASRAARIGAPRTAASMAGAAMEVTSHDLEETAAAALRPRARPHPPPPPPPPPRVGLAGALKKHGAPWEEAKWCSRDGLDGALTNGVEQALSTGSPGMAMAVAAWSSAAAMAGGGGLEWQ